MAVEKTVFGFTKDGKEVHKYFIANESGASIEVLDFGAILYSVCVPDKEGLLRDVVLGFDRVEDYETSGTFFGATVGRSGNRIANASFSMNGVVYQMEKNENENNLHSGSNGFERRMWEVSEAENDHITFALISPDGDQGFPGEFKVSVTYTLTEENEVKIHYEGSCDQDTVANMTNHSYFNLGGHDSGSMLGQLLWLNADAFTPVIDTKSIPTGEIAPVAGTPMDFTTEKAIGKDIDADYDQLNFTGGYDHNFVLNQQDGSVRLVAKAKSEESGIGMEVYTDAPGVQFYAGNFLAGEIGKEGVKYEKRNGFCLETQYYPNSVNEPSFPSPVLKKGEKYDTTTIYRFI